MTAKWSVRSNVRNLLEYGDTNDLRLLTDLLTDRPTNQLNDSLVVVLSSNGQKDSEAPLLKIEKNTHSLDKTSPISAELFGVR